MIFGWDRILGGNVMKRFASLLAFSLLAGCAVAPVRTPVGFGDPNLKAVRSILQQGQPTDAIFKTGKPFAFVLLDDNDSGRNKKICEDRKSKRLNSSH